MICLNAKIKLNRIAIITAINDEIQNKLLPLENVQDHGAVEVSYELSIFNQIQQWNWAWKYMSTQGVWV